jgi:two-component system sensor histidine kinase CreC
MRVTQFSLLAVLIIVITGFGLLADHLMNNLERETYQATEEVLVDMANVLAAVVQAGVKDHRLDPAVLRDSYPLALDRRFNAAIFDMEKQRVGSHVYLTDSSGVVVYDSDSDLHTGRDLSEYRDVALTLSGKYGARSSRYVPNDSSTSVLHVAAPVYDGRKVIGVLTVRKPKVDQWFFVQQRRSRILISTVLIGSGIALFVGAVLYWVLHPLRRLTAYVQAVKRGERPARPAVGDSMEVNTLANALEEMREELEGRDYAATFVQTLTHELKSPLAAIRATAELLAENNMDEVQRRRFTETLRHECERTEHLIRQLLHLAEVERQKSLQKRDALDLRKVVEQACAELTGAAEAKGVRWRMILPDDACVVEGDDALLRRAIMNVIENAVDFSPPGDEVEIRLFTAEAQHHLVVLDQGPGIPDYAVPRLFERFYSLKHKQTGRKGSGLGLCFAREAAGLHGGGLTLRNGDRGGAWAELVLPQAPKGVS